MTVTLAAAALAPFDAEANTSNGSPTGYAWADNQGATGMVIARYATLPAAAGAGDGTINYPTVPEVYDYGNLAATVPVETITATAVNATTWDISGSVSGAHGQATTGVEYTTDHGVNFTITAGGIAFATGDTFIFDINDSVNASLVAGHLSYPILGTSTITIHSSTADFDWFNTDFFGSNNAGIGISSTGYLAVGDAFPAAGEDYREATSTNRQLPTVAAIADGSNDESIYPFWDALVGKSGSSINVASFGRAGQRMMVVQWSDFAHESDPTASFTFSVVLFENQDTVRFHYRTMSNGTGTAADGSSATIGGQGLVTDDFFGLNYGFEDPVVSNGLTIEIGDDNDGDGLPLRFEGSYGTSDNDSTSDDGLALDGAQLLAGLNPTVAGDNPTTDGDSDNLIDINETFLGLNPALADSDGDLVADDVEITAGTDPLKPDSDGDGLDDGVEDANQDGVVDPTETDPTDWDSDDDGTSDGFEVQVTTDPLDANVSRFTPVAEFSDPGSQITQEAALDSKGNLHVVSYSSASGSNQAPDNLYVGLYTDDGGSYDLSVDMTVLTSHIGYDDRQPTLVTVPQAGAMDKTLVFNGTKQGHAF
ncbi:MAG: hypothetical protein GY811_10165, partial [Myxococcales bacterium]|nr:hypothetical protein [Myxococcales bacterium]